MNYENIIVEIKEGIAYVTLNRPKALNALNAQLIKEIGACFSALEDEAIVGVIMTGSGEKAFAAGADISEFGSLTEESCYELSKAGHEVFNQVEAFIKPVIAVVNGFCLGGGCELAMACHMRIAEEHARFGQPEVNLGLLPGYGATQRMTKLIGKARSIEYHVTADMIDADTAVQIGLVNHKTPLGEGVAKAEEILKKVATKGPLAVSACINVINKYDDHEVDAFDLESKLFAKVMLTEDAKEGTQAFMEKRKANFKGQ